MEQETSTLRTWQAPPAQKGGDRARRDRRDPGLQGDRVSGARKNATLETGYVIQVPLFVETGEKLKVDTRTGDYLTRA